MKSADGKKIAVNSARVKQFAGVIEKDRVSEARVKQLRTQLDTLTGPVKRAILEANRTEFPSDAILPDIEKIGREVGTKLREIREIKVEMDTILADSAATPPGEKTLENVLSELEAAKARKRSEMIAKQNGNDARPASRGVRSVWLPRLLIVDHRFMPAGGRGRGPELSAGVLKIGRSERR